MQKSAGFLLLSTRPYKNNSSTFGTFRIGLASQTCI